MTDIGTKTGTSWIDLNSAASIEEMSQRAAALAISRPIFIGFKGVDLSIPSAATADQIFKAYKAREFDVWAEKYDQLFVTINRDFYAAFAEVLQQQVEEQPDILERILDIGCGEGFVARALYADAQRFRVNSDLLLLREIPTLTQHSVYLGIDPSNRSCELLEGWFKQHSSVFNTQFASHLVRKSAGLLLDSTFRQSIIDQLGGSPRLVAMGVAFHVLAKTMRADKQAPELLIKALAETSQPGTRIVIGNYYHLAGDKDGEQESDATRADFEAFAVRYKQAFSKAWQNITGSMPIVHEPTPPALLFPPQIMASMLERSGFHVMSCKRGLANKALADDQHPGLRAYVMVAEYKRTN